MILKNPWEWDESDLEAMVNAGTQESIELDFKASPSLQNDDKKKDEISKDVSAFANSAGGTLLYGMLEDRSTHVAMGLDTGSDPTVITKEWLEQIINSRIQRRIDGIRINQIPLTKSPGRVAYAVYVPASTRAPHQASDKKFYKRFNFHSVPMEEYEIRDVARRGEVPDLRIVFSLPKTELIFNQGDTFSVPFPLPATITNDALEPANYTVIKLYIDARLAIQNAQEFTNNNVETSFNVEYKSIPVKMLQLNWSIPAKMPIFNAEFLLTTKPITLRSPSDGRPINPKFYLLGYEIQSPRMPLKSSCSVLEVRSGSISLYKTNLTEKEVLANYDKLQK